MNAYCHKIVHITSIFIICFFISTVIKAQIGLNAQFTPYSIEIEDEVSRNYFYSFGIDYKYAFEYKRIEILVIGKFITSPNSDLDIQGIGGEIQGNFYVFDLDGDCDCPKIFKENDFFKKAFFISAFVGYHNFSNLNDNISDNMIVGIGAGLDIGLSDKLILTPQIQVLNRKSINQVKEDAIIEGFSFRPGLRFGYYFK